MTDRGPTPDLHPLLLIDVDGVLNPFAAKRCPAGYVEEQIAGFPVRLRAADGPALLAYADRFELAWATTWEDQANTEIGPRIGLPPLPVIHFDFDGLGRRQARSDRRLSPASGR